MRILEKDMKNFEYIPPTDPELLLYDFYFLVSFLPQKHENPELRYTFLEALDTCVSNLKEHMLKALKWSLSCEIAHTDGDSVYHNEERLSKGAFAFYERYYYNVRKLRSDTEESSNKAVNQAQKKLGISDSNLFRYMEEIYTKTYWMTGFGGKAWAQIAKAAYKLVESTTLMEDVIYIDHAYDLQHNTGSVFDKVKEYYKQGDIGWLNDALDWKKENTDIRGFYKRVSSSLRYVVAWVAKNEHDVSLEDYKDPNKPDVAKMQKVVLRLYDKEQAKDFLKRIDHLNFEWIGDPLSEYIDNEDAYSLYILLRAKYPRKLEVFVWESQIKGTYHYTLNNESFVDVAEQIIEAGAI